MEDVGSKRKRSKTARYNFDFMENEEQRMLQQALKISKKDVKRVAVDVPDAPVFYPTSEEFKDPMAYIKKIRPLAESKGMFKIVPPPDWNYPCQITMDNPKRFPTKLQKVHTLQQGLGFEDGATYNIREYKAMADRFFEHWKDTHHGGQVPTVDMLAKDYWDMVETGMQSAAVEYGNDVDSLYFGSGFPKQTDPDTNMYSRWNMNRLPVDASSLLKFLKAPISGINVPWIYIGMLFATFCWHYEDNNLYSINYSHFGSTKQWYGVPGHQAELFEKVAKDYLLGLFREVPDILHHVTTQIPPSLLMSNGIDVYKASQEAGTFVITFPRSFHGGFSCGFNVGEAVNFATFDWLPFGGIAEERYRLFGREPIFSHQRLLFTLLRNKEHFESSEIATLYKMVVKSLEEEVNGRNYAIEQGIRDLSASIVLPENDFSIISKKVMDYDDMRSCAVCKQICVFSAIGCECDRVRVACIGHHNALCKCPREKKFMLTWAKTSALSNLKTDIVARLK